MTTASSAAANTPAAARGTAVERFQMAGVAAVTSGHAIHDTYTAFLPPLLPSLIDRFGLSTAQGGLLSIFLQWPSVVQPFIGYLADHVNLRYLVIFAPAVTGMVMSVVGIAPGYAVLGILLIVAGISAAGLHAVGPVLVANLAGQKLGRGMGLWMVGGGLGYTVGPLILVAALERWTARGVPWLMIGGIVTSAVLFVRLRNVSTCSDRLTRSRPWRQALRAMSPVLWPVIGITLVRSFLSAALSTYLPTFLSREGNNLWFAGASLSIYEAAGMAGAVTVASLSDRFGRRRMLATVMAVTSPLMGLFLAARGPAQFPILLALGFSMMSMTPVIMAMLQERFPENRALANGIYMGLTFVVQAAATVILGALGDRFGLRPAYIFSALLPLLGLPLIGLLPGDTRRASP